MPPIKGNMLNYSEEQMKAAIAAVSNGESVASAAKNNGVPRSTLILRLKGNALRFGQMGPEAVLSRDEEKTIVFWIFAMAKAGFPIGKEALLTSVQHLIRELKRKNPFKNDKPGKKWYYSFLKRNPEVSTRTAQNLTISRASVTKEQLENWFQEVKTYITDNKYEEILNDPKRIFNGDESAFFLNPKGNKVLARKGDKTIYQQVNSDEKECLTVLITGNADGKIAPPMIVFRYLRIPREIIERVPGSWGIGKSESGWMTGETFYEYITNVFHPWLLDSEITLPIILFIDGHASHLTFHLSKFCDEKGIILIALFPNATHLIQPMDVAVFRTLKDGWKNKVQEWRLANYESPVLKKINFAPLLNEILENRVTPSVLQNGFRKSGLFPWNPNNVEIKSDINDSDIPMKTNEEENILRIKFLENGLKFLEESIEKDKISAFKNCNTWEGDVRDHSLFHLFKEKTYELEGLKTPKGNITKATENLDDQDNDNPRKQAEHQNKQALNQVTDDTTEGGSNSESFAKPLTPKKPQTTTTDITIDHSQRSTSSTSSSYLIPSPFKRALFWPEPKETKSSKRAKKEKVPSVITSLKWQEYHEKKQREKIIQEENKQKRNEQRKFKKEEKERLKKEKQEMKKRKKLEKPKTVRRKVYSSSDSDSYEDWQESGDSLDEISDDDISFTRNSEIPIDENPITEGNINKSDKILDKILETPYQLPKAKDPKNDKENKILNQAPSNSYKEGDYIVVSFPGKKREYKYVCVIQEICNEDEIEIVAMVACDETKSSFKLNENDVSVIRLIQIIEKLDFPDISCSGDRLKYEFHKKLDVDG